MAKPKLKFRGSFCIRVDNRGTTTPFSPNVKPRENSNLGHALVKACISADKDIRKATRNNFAKKQALTKKVRNQKVAEYVSISGLNKTVKTDENGQQYVTTLTKRRFNPTREELRAIHTQGLQHFATL